MNKQDASYKILIPLHLCCRESVASMPAVSLPCWSRARAIVSTQAATVRPQHSRASRCCSLSNTDTVQSQAGLNIVR